MKTPLTIIICLLFYKPLLTQNLSTNDIKTDYDFFVKEFNECHSYPLRNTDSTELWTIMENEISEIIESGDSVESIDVSKIYSHFFANLKDGHSGLNKWSTVQKTGIQYFFPILVYKKPSGGFVKVNSENQFDYIHAINNIPIEDIFSAFEQYVVSETRTKENLTGVISREFIFLMTFYFDFQNKKTFNIEVSEKLTGEHRTETLSLVKTKYPEMLEYPKMTSFWTSDRKYIEMDFWIDPRHASYSKTTKNYSVICLDLAYRPRKFRKEISKKLNHMMKKNVDTLIIDLRGNGGGRAINAAYFYQLFTDSVAYWYDKDPNTGEVWYHLPNFNDKKSWTLPGRKNAEFDHIFVLTNKFTFSAATECAYYMSLLDNVTILGESPDETLPQSYNPEIINLPNSKFIIYVSKGLDYSLIRPFNTRVLKPDVQYFWDRENAHDDKNWRTQDVDKHFKKICKIKKN